MRTESLPVRGCAVNGGTWLRARVAFGLPSLRATWNTEYTPGAVTQRTMAKAQHELARPRRSSAMVRDLPKPIGSAASVVPQDLDRIGYVQRP